jgi:adenine-specific DNA-methyltransferase
MAKPTKAKASKKKPIEQYDHKGKKRVNNPPVGLVTPATDKESGKKTYAYDPHLDPQLVWAGKAERTSFEVPTVSLHVHERIDPRTIVEAVRRRNGQADQQMSLFQSPEENPPLREAIEFRNWRNSFFTGVNGVQSEPKVRCQLTKRTPHGINRSRSSECRN